MRPYYISKYPSFYTITLNDNKADVELREKFGLNTPLINQGLCPKKVQDGDSLLALLPYTQMKCYGFNQQETQNQAQINPIAESLTQKITKRLAYSLKKERVNSQNNVTRIQKMVQPEIDSPCVKP